MIITGMKHFENVCQKKLVEWYRENRPGVEIDLGDVFIVWSCKTLQNYKCLASTTISGDGIYAEYTFNGDKQELYEDVYKNLTNLCHKEEEARRIILGAIFTPKHEHGLKLLRGQ